MEDPAEPKSRRTPADGRPATDDRIDALADAIEPRLPTPPGRILLVGDPAVVEGLAGRLRTAGHRPVTLRDPGAPETVASEQADGVVLVLPPEAPSSSDLAGLRGRIAAEGRLLILLPSEAGAGDGSTDGPERLEDVLIRRLYETRWVALDEGAEASGIVVLVARPADHRIRPFRAGDEKAILDLFERAFHHRRSLERWRWTYAENPWGNGRISLAWDDDDVVAAHYAGYPIPFWSDLDGSGRTLLAHHVGDTMTSPEARRVGRGRTNLLTRTVHHFYATWCRGRIAFNYGTNTGKVQRFSRRTAGARHLEPVAYRIRELDEELVVPGALRRRLGGWRVERIDPSGGLGDRWDSFWTRVRPTYRFLVARDRRYLEWRVRCPDAEPALWAVFRRGALVGWSLFRRDGDRLVWGDALFDRRRPRAAALLLRAVAEAPEHRGCEAIEGWFPDRPRWWDEVLVGLGFRREPEPEDLGLVYVPFEEDPGEAMARHLYYTKADFDLF